MSAGGEKINPKLVAARLREVADAIERASNVQGVAVFASPDGALVHRITLGDAPSNFWLETAQLLASENERRKNEGRPYDPFARVGI